MTAIADIKKELRAAMNGIASQHMRQRGLDYHVNFGVELPRLQDIASAFEPDEELALRLWHEDVRESKILAAMLMPADALSPDQCDALAQGIPNAEIAQTTALYLFSRLPFAEGLVARWLPERPLLSFLVAARLLIIGQALGPQTRDALRQAAEQLMPTADVHLSKAIRNALLRLEE